MFGRSFYLSKHKRGLTLFFKDQQDWCRSPPGSALGRSWCPKKDKWTPSWAQHVTFLDPKTVKTQHVVNLHRNVHSTIIRRFCLLYLIIDKVNCPCICVSRHTKIKAPDHGREKSRETRKSLLQMLHELTNICLTIVV
jgi:hypothetical protein